MNIPLVLVFFRLTPLVVALDEVPPPPTPAPSAAVLASSAASGSAAASAVNPTPSVSPAPVPRPAVAAWTLRLGCDAGYDSNALREDQATSVASERGGLTYGADASATWRVVRGTQAAVTLVADGRYQAYDETPGANQTSLGASALGLWRLGWLDPAIIVGGQKQWFADYGDAMVVRGGVLATHVYTTRSHVDIWAFDHYDVTFARDEAASGWLQDVTWRHWWLPRAGDITRRVELNLVAGWYHAATPSASYRHVKPEIVTRWRATPMTTWFGVWDVMASLAGDGRFYEREREGEPPPRSVQWHTQLAAERQLGAGLTAGPWLTWQHQTTTRVVGDYERWTAALRLTASW